MILNNKETELYFTWLVDYKTNLVKDDLRFSHGFVARRMFEYNFSAFVKFDENRISDGYNLRRYYNNHRSRGRLLHRNDLMNEPVSVLEVLIALADRMVTQIIPKNNDIETTHDCLMLMFENLGLYKITDSVINHLRFSQKGHFFEMIDQSITRFVDRTYDRFGRGGIFPLQYSKVDQRKVELWYQMNEYLIANGYILS